jgi:hypothetical protein
LAPCTRNVALFLEQDAKTGRGVRGLVSVVRVNRLLVAARAAAVRSTLLLEHGAKAEGDSWGYVGVAGVDRLLVGVGYAGIRRTGNYRTLKTDGRRCSRPGMVRRSLMITAPGHRRAGPWAAGNVFTRGG